MQISGSSGASAPQPVSQDASGSIDPLQFNTELLTAFMNSPQGRTDGPYRLSPEGIGKPGPAFYYAGTRPALAGGIMTFSDNPDYLDTAELQGQDASGIAGDLISAFGSNGSLSLAQVEHVYQVDDPSVNAPYREQTKALLEADWNVLSGGSSTMTADQLSTAIDKYVTNSSSDTPKQWGPITSDESGWLSQTQLATAIQNFAMTQDVTQEQLTDLTV